MRLTNGYVCVTIVRFVCASKSACRSTAIHCDPVACQGLRCIFIGLSGCGESLSDFTTQFPVVCPSFAVDSSVATQHQQPLNCFGVALVPKIFPDHGCAREFVGRVGLCFGLFHGRRRRCSGYGVFSRGSWKPFGLLLFLTARDQAERKHREKQKNLCHSPIRTRLKPNHF